MPVKKLYFPEMLAGTHPSGSSEPLRAVCAGHGLSLKVCAWGTCISGRSEYKLNFSDMLQSLVGQQNARYGIIKIFNALQEKRANKHLLYVSKASQRIHCFFSCTFLFTYGGRC